VRGHPRPSASCSTPPWDSRAPRQERPRAIGYANWFIDQLDPAIGSGNAAYLDENASNPDQCCTKARFGELLRLTLRKITLNPAMGEYLDMVKNAKIPEGAAGYAVPAYTHSGRSRLGPRLGQSPRRARANTRLRERGLPESRQLRRPYAELNGVGRQDSKISLRIFRLSTHYIFECIG